MQKIDAKPSISDSISEVRIIGFEALIDCTKESLKSCGRFLWTSRKGNSVEGQEPPCSKCDASV